MQRPSSAVPCDAAIIVTGPVSPPQRSPFAAAAIDDDGAAAADDEAAHAQTQQRLQPPEFILKHPLQRSWTLWYFRADRTRNWEDNQRPIISFNTVEDFWSIVSYIELSSKLVTGCDYSLFKDGIKPMWEDEANRAGGRWLVALERDQRSEFLDTFWLETMMMLIGEAFDDRSPFVNGAVVSVRLKGDKVGLWLSDSVRSEVVLYAGRKLKERLGIDQDYQIGFEAHADTMRKTGSESKVTFSI